MKIKIDWLYLLTTHYRVSRKELPGRCPWDGWVYFIYHGDVLLYIGKAKDLRQRLSGHHVYNKKFHKVTFFATTDYTFAETLNIRQFNPPLNYNEKLQNQYRASLRKPQEVL